ncbi:polymer-forming cytoskeletal protein [Pseudoroseomonas wenyumeiae]
MSFFGKPSGGEPRITYERIDLTANDAVLAPAAPSFTTRPAPAATTVVRPAPTVEPPAMLIAADSELEGRLRSHGAVQIEGVLRGELVAASVMVAPGGLIEGLVTVEHAQIDGTLRGTVVARDVEISRTAMVDAELVYEEIGIARGARVHGLHRRREPEPAPRAEADALSSRSLPCRCRPRHWRRPCRPVPWWPLPRPHCRNWPRSPRLPPALPPSWRRTASASW